MTEAFEHIALRVKDDGVAVITLNRPEHANAYTGLMGTELGEAYRRCDVDDEIRVVVLTGAGDAFCVGAGLTGATAFEAPDEKTFSAAGVDPPAWRVRKPVIAAMNGHAVGLGLTLAVQCDIRFAAEQAKYGIVQNRRGVVPDAYSHWIVPRVMGLSRAAEMLLTGRMYRGTELAEIGLASRALPSGDVLPHAIEMAHDIAVNTAPLSAGMSKRLLWDGLELDRSQVGRLETLLHLHVMGTADSREGAAAFLERREPEWQLTLTDDWPEWPAT